MRIAVVDIGGTNIKSGIWEEDKIIEQKETPTQAAKGGEHVVAAVMELLHAYQNFDAIGISSTGQVNSQEGTILYANQNMPAYTGTPMKELLWKEFQVPVAVQNDVNCAAVGEAYYGAGTDSMNFLCLTYGTGVGGAIVINGKLYTGASYCAGEFGAIITHPDQRIAGQDKFSGCYERYASTSALVKKAKQVDDKLTNGYAVLEQIGRPEVSRIVSEWIDEVVIGLVSLIHIFNPSLIILGGGIMEQEMIITRIQEKLRPQIMESFAGVKVVPAKLGNMAGLLGAAQEAMEVYHENNSGK